MYNIFLNSLKSLTSTCILIWYSYLLFSCTNDDSIILETQRGQLEYSPDLALILDSWGLSDVTKLDEEIKEDIESLNIRYSKIPSTTFNGQIVIIDGNGNGKFEYDSIDIIGLTSFNDKLKFNTINYSKSIHPIVIKIGDEKYEVNFIEDGSNIKLVNLNKSQLPYDLTYPYNIPNVNVKKLTKNATLNKENNKYTYVEFWGTWCKPCIELIPEIQTLQKDFSDQLNIISVDYRDRDFNRVKRYIKKYKMSWDHIIADDTLMDEFGRPNFFPCGVFFDPRGNLIEFGISPNKVREHLENNS